VSENGIYILYDLFLLMGIIQKLTLQTYFPRKRDLFIPDFGDVTIPRNKFKLIANFFAGFEHQ
jgi:hypothetical protein